MLAAAAAQGDLLNTLADVASIITAAIAVVAYIHFGLGAVRQRRRLEQYLKGEVPQKREDGDTGARTVVHLMGKLGMTEAAILDAAFRSSRLERVIAADPATGKAKEILLRYKR